jgi:hypothetical protein
MPDSQELAELRKEPEPAPSTEEENLRNLREKLARESPEDARVYRMVAHRRGIPVGDESAPNRAIALEDFWAYLPQHAYIYVPTLEIWPAASVNAKLPPVTIGSEMQDDGTAKTRNVKPATWLDIHRSVEQMREASGSGDAALVAETDFGFHERLLGISASPIVLQAWRTLAGRLRMSLAVSNVIFLREVGDVAESHRPILEALGGPIGIAAEHVEIAPAKPQQHARWYQGSAAGWYGPESLGAGP